MKEARDGKFPREWERVERYTYRLEVPGGWIVATTQVSENGVGCFVPDPDKYWVLEDEAKP